MVAPAFSAVKQSETPVRKARSPNPVDPPIVDSRVQMPKRFHFPEKISQLNTPSEMRAGIAA